MLHKDFLLKKKQISVEFWTCYCWKFAKSEKRKWREITSLVMTHERWRTIAHMNVADKEVAATAGCLPGYSTLCAVTEKVGILLRGKPCWSHTIIIGRNADYVLQKYNPVGYVVDCLPPPPWGQITTCPHDRIMPVAILYILIFFLFWIHSMLKIPLNSW